MQILTPEHQRILDDEHLRLLRIGYFIMGGTASFGLLFGGIYLVMGLVFSTTFASMPHSPAANAPPAFLGWIFAAVGGAIVVLAGTYSTLCFLTGRALIRSRSRTLCYITAGLSCMYIPFGTALGIATFVVLGRPSVQGLYPGASPPRLPSDVYGAPPPPPLYRA